MKVTLLFSCLIGLIFLSLPALPVSAYSKNLSPDEIQTAIEYGKSRRGQDIVDATSPYYIKLPGFSAAIVFTPWLQIASEARKAATEYRDLGVTQAQTTFSAWQGKLQVGFFFIESERGQWWRDGHTVLIQGQTIVQPSQKVGAFNRIVSCRTEPCTTSATVVATFPDSNLDPTSEVELVFVFPGGYKELRGKANLGAMR